MEQMWIFERLAVSLVRVDFLDPALADHADTRERGVRLELRVVASDGGGSIYASPGLSLQPAACRIDLLESAPHAVDRMHWHPVMAQGEPGDRTFDVTMVEDPLRWLTERLTQVDELLAEAGVAPDETSSGDVEAVRAVVPDIVDAARRGLEWARVQPWPAVEHDDRGMAHA